MTGTNTDNNKPPEAPSNVYLVRLRAAATGGEKAWYGRVQHLISGQALTFHTLEDLPDLIVALHALQCRLDNIEGGEQSDES